MIYGYARVSTKGQAHDGNGLEVQERELRSCGAEVVFSDAYTGKKKERPELRKLLNAVSEGDTIIVMKMDRLARSIRDGLDIIDEILNKNVMLKIMNMGIFDNSSAGQLLRAVMLAFAEFERNMIIERTTAGKRIAKENKPDYREGRPRKEVEDFQKFFEKQKGGLCTVAECCAELGISKSTWYNLCRKC